MFELLWVFAGAQLLSMTAIAATETILPDSEPRPDRGAMALGMVLTSSLMGATAVTATLLGVPAIPAMVGIPAALAILLAMIQILLVRTATARNRMVMASMVATAILATVILVAGM